MQEVELSAQPVVLSMENGFLCVITSESSMFRMEEGKLIPMSEGLMGKLRDAGCSNDRMA